MEIFITLENYIKISVKKIKKIARLVKLQQIIKLRFPLNIITIVISFVLFSSKRGNDARTNVASGRRTECSNGPHIVLVLQSKG